MKRIKLKDRKLPSYTVGEEIMNMVTHIVGGALGLVALVLCLRKANSPMGILCALIYGLSMICLYAMSSIYHGLRPGMPVVTKMGNGQYMMIYEIVGLPGNPVYYKIAKDPLNWGDPSNEGTLLRDGTKSLAATPWVTWGNVGGENGMLVATGWRMASGTSETGSDMFVSFDYGKTWTAIPNFYSYVWTNDNCTWGYSASIVFSADGKTMYYMANPQGTFRGSTCYTLFRISVT